MKRYLHLIPFALSVLGALIFGSHPLSRIRIRSSGSSLDCLPKLLKSFGYICAFSFISSAFAGEKNPVPRFVSFKSNEVNVRVGPGANYPIEWIYLKAGLPIEVIAEFDTWRKIRDKDGTQGWVHQNMLSSKRYAIVQASESLLYSQENTDSSPLVRLEKGVMVELFKCRNEWCQVGINDFKGWVQRCARWGHYPEEWLG